MNNVSLLCLNICHYGSDDHSDHKRQQAVLTSCPTCPSRTKKQPYAVLPPVNGETYSTALIDFSQLSQQQQLVAVQQVYSIHSFVICCGYMQCFLSYNDNMLVLHASIIYAVLWRSL